MWVETKIDNIHNIQQRTNSFLTKEKQIYRAFLKNFDFLGFWLSKYISKDCIKDISKDTSEMSRSRINPIR